MALSLVGLGSNLEDRSANLQQAMGRLASLPRTSQLAESRCLPTLPIGGPAAQAEFLNAAVLLETTLAPDELLASLHRIEVDLGAHKDDALGIARSIDLDLLLYDDLVLETPELTVPHPRMAFRRFVLEPAVEIAPDMVHPEIGWTVRQLLEHLNSAPNYVALDGGPPEFRQALAERVAQDTPAKAFLFSPATDSSARNTGLDLLPTVDSLRDSGVGISDFWLEAIVPAPGVPRSRALTPKLLVRLENSPSPIPFPGPVLNLQTRDLSEAAAEIVAAIHAMR